MGRKEGARKGMFYNEPNQRRALTLAARTNGMLDRAVVCASSYRVSSFPDSRSHKSVSLDLLRPPKLRERESPRSTSPEDESFVPDINGGQNLSA